MHQDAPYLALRGRMLTQNQQTGQQVCVCPHFMMGSEQKSKHNSLCGQSKMNLFQLHLLFYARAIRLGGERRAATRALSGCPLARVFSAL